MNKKWIWIPSLIAAAIVVFILYFPSYLETNTGKKIFIRAIEKKTKAKAAIDQLHLSWMGPQKIEGLTLESDDFDGQIKSIQAGVSLWNLSGLFDLEKLGAINSDVRLEEANLSFHYEGHSANIENAGGFLHLHGDKADILFTGGSSGGSLVIQGQLTRDLSQFSIRANLSSFPTLPFAYFFAARQLMSKDALLQIIGPTFNLDSSASYDDEDKGLIDIALHSPNVNGEFHGAMQNDLITLRQAMTATFHLTPELSQTLLGDANPLFVTGISAEKPIYLRIEPSQFHWSLPLTFEGLQIGQGTLDAGKITCENGGTLALLISLLKKDFFTAGRTMEVWFSPLSFQVHKGTLQTGRMDALVANSLHLCSWGDIELEKGRLDMSLGLTADTLRKAFGIRNLADDYVLKIQLKGTVAEPKLATSAALAKIAALLAAQKTAKGLPGGIVNLFTQQQNDIPPANHPLPWE